MANLSNINNKFLVTTTGEVLVGRTAATGTSKLQVSGSLLIGTDINSGIPLVVQETTADGFAIGFMRNTNATNGNGLVIDVNSTAGAYIQDWRQASTVKMRLLQNGNLGIGASLPGAKLEIASSTATGALTITQSAEVTGNAMVYIDNNSASNKPALRIDVAAGGNSTDTHGVIINNNGPGYGLIVNGGKVGIGTTTPSSYDGESNDLVVASGVDGAVPTPGITIACLGDTATTGRGALRFADGTTGNEKYRGALEYNHSGDDMSFRTAGAVKMVLTDAGDVGIGTTLPTTALTIRKAIPAAASSYGLQASMVDFKSYYPGYDTETVKSAIYSGVSAQTTLQTTKGFMSFWTADEVAGGGESLTEKMRIESNGNVGIGTTSPDTKLHVHSTSGDGKLRVSGDNIENSGGEIKGFNNGFAFNVAPSGGGTYVERMRINGSGNVGIGATSPLGKLHVSTGTDTSVGNIEFFIGGTNGGNARSGKIIKNTSSPYEMTIRASNFTNGNNLILNDTGGNVGIGTGSASPSAKLHVQSDSSTDVIFKLDNTNVADTAGAQIQLIADDAGSGNQNGALRHSIRSQIAGESINWEIHSGANFEELQFSTGDEFAMIINTNQNVGIGTTTPDALISTADSNAYTQEWKYAKGYRHFTTYPTGSDGNYNISTKISFNNLRGLCVDYYESGHLYNNGAAYYFRHTRFYIMMEGTTLRINDVELIKSTGNRTDAIVNAPAATTNASLECLITSTIKSGFTHYVSADMVGSGFNKIKSIS